MALPARKVFGTFEKRAPGINSFAHSGDKLAWLTDRKGIAGKWLKFGPMQRGSVGDIS